MRAVVRHQLFRLAGMAALLPTLCACATLSLTSAPDYQQSMATARIHADAGQVPEAVAVLQQAAAAQPARKEPWLMIARLRADQGRHVDALAAAEQVLRRDPADRDASGISIDSGLQVALHTMQRLRAAGEAPDGEVAEQGRRIALLMAEVFPPELLITEEVRSRWAQEAVESYRASRASKLPGAQTEPRGDPLDLLGGD